MKITRFVFICWCVFMASSSGAEQKEDLDALIDETSQLIVAYRSLSGDNPENFSERIQLLEAALENINMIPFRYPTDARAIEILGSGTIGDLSISELQIEKLEIEQNLVCSQDYSGCAIERALQAVDRIENKPDLAQSMIAIAKAQEAVGDELEAAKILSDAILVVNELGTENYFFKSLSLEIAIELANLGDIEGAVEIVTSFGSDYTRAVGLQSIAEQQIFSGDLVGAQKTLAQALVEIKKVTHLDSLVFGLTLIAETQSNAGDVSSSRSILLEAKEIYLTNFNNTEWMRAPRGLVQAHVSGHNLTGAFEIIQTANGDVDQLLSIVVAGQIDEGDLIGALDTARAIVSNGTRSFALRNLAVAFSNVGEAASAISVIQQIPNPFARTQALVGTATVEGSNQLDASAYVEAAMLAAKTEESDIFRPLALAEVAKAQAILGDQAGANLTLSEAAQTACAISEGVLGRKNAIIEVIEVFSEISEPWKAFQTTLCLENDLDKVEAFVSIAKLLSERR